MSLINLALAIVGSIAIGSAVFILIDQPFQRIWSRHWLRQRLRELQIQPKAVKLPINQHVANQNLTPDALMNEEMANLLETVGREMQLGRSPTGALLHTHHAYPLVATFVRPLIQSCERGVSLTEALRTHDISSSSSSVPSGVVFGFRALWAATTGSAGAQALDRAAATLRQRTAIEYERKAQSAQARLSVQILTWLPIVFLGWQIITNPSSRWFLLASPFGWVLLGGGLGLNWFGRQWMNRVIRGAN